jgi:hypothetical protein
MANTRTLPDLNGAKQPVGSQYDFVVGSDAEGIADGTPVTQILVGNVADFIVYNGVSFQTVNGKVLGSVIRLLAVDTGAGMQWVVEFITGIWQFV